MKEIRGSLRRKHIPISTSEMIPKQGVRRKGKRKDDKSGTKRLQK